MHKKWYYEVEYRSFVQDLFLKDPCYAVCNSKISSELKLNEKFACAKLAQKD